MSKIQIEAFDLPTAWMVFIEREDGYLFSAYPRSLHETRATAAARAQELRPVMGKKSKVHVVKVTAHIRPANSR